MQVTRGNIFSRILESIREAGGRNPIGIRINKYAWRIESGGMAIFSAAPIFVWPAEADHSAAHGIENRAVF